MGITFNAKITKQGDFKFDEMVSELLELKHGDTVSITINVDDEPLSDNLYVLKYMLEEAEIDGSNGLLSYVDGNSIVIIGANEPDEEWEDYEDYE